MGAADLYRLDGRVAVVTGAARGIGEVISRHLGELGATVVMADRLPLVEQTAATLADEGIKTAWDLLDVTDRQGVDDFVARVVERHGAIDCLVANAGVANEALTVDHTDEQWRQVMDVNCDGVFYVLRAVGRQMVKQQRGSIVAISSIAGVKYVRPERHLGYDVSKAAVAHMCRVLGCEWAPEGVRVNAVGPGYTDTEMLAEVGRAKPEVLKMWLDDIPMGRLLDRREIASSVAFLLSDAASGITGHLLMADAGYSVS
ncbi:MAG: SDR family oxidoreductase [Bauldia sp.]|nr:SDR family oxidoreductase [Bauldia sp.]